MGKPKESSLPSVLFINRVYPPQEGATGQLLAELASQLTEKGWAVTIIASGEAFAEDHQGLIRVHRVGGLPFNRSSHLKRAFSYLSLYPKFLIAAWREPRHDLVVTLTDPPLHLVLGPFLKWFKKTKIVHWAQDIYPEIAEELGVLRKGGLVANLLRFVSAFSLRRYEAVVTVGRCMKKRLESRRIPVSRITVIPNWPLESSSSQSDPAGASEFRACHNLNGKFVVMYSGNFGLAHPFEAIVQAVREIAKTPLIHFVFLGGGPRYEWVREQCRGMANATFLPYQPIKNLNASLGAADIHLACMEQNLEGLVVPSKIYGIMAAAKPCLFLGPAGSEAAQLIHELNCGWNLEMAQFSQLAPILTKLACNPEPLIAMGQRGYQYTVTHGSTCAAAQFFDLFQKLT
ncbi:MAG: glycosyltransferase WbuB [Verrucomicrobiales bacterium]|nr:glycosyltransferase WbuB [Verrucomicrobiales bacterium]